MAMYTQKVFLRTASCGKFILPFWAHIFTICAVLCSETCLRSSFTWLLCALASLSSSHSQKNSIWVTFFSTGWVCTTFLPSIFSCAWPTSGGLKPPNYPHYECIRFFLNWELEQLNSPGQETWSQKRTVWSKAYRQWKHQLICITLLGGLNPIPGFT